MILGLIPLNSNEITLSGNKLQLRAILSAVYNLSPVSIRTLIFALRKSFKVYGTISCNLSYKAVAPINTN